MSVTVRLHQAGYPNTPVSVVLEIDRDLDERPVLMILSPRQTLDLVRVLADLLYRKDSGR